MMVAADLTHLTFGMCVPPCPNPFEWLNGTSAALRLL
jgi:hypothetical protein